MVKPERRISLITGEDIGVVSQSFIITSVGSMNRLTTIEISLCKRDELGFGRNKNKICG